MSTVYIALGANLGNPMAQLTSAVAAFDTLPASRLLRRSSWYRSRAIGPGEQDDYINGVAMLETRLSPASLLLALKQLEQSNGRVQAERWAARPLDLDILLYDNLQLDSEDLQIPHPRMTGRNFVLVPLYELAPGLVLPDGSSLADLVDNVGKEGLWRLPEAGGARGK